MATGSCSSIIDFPSEIATGRAFASHVNKLVEELGCSCPESQVRAAAELRIMSKNSKENRDAIGRGGAIPPLVSLLNSNNDEAQTQAVTALLNLSISWENKTMIAEVGAVELLILVLRHGRSEAKENSATTLFSLAEVDKYNMMIGQSAAAVAALVDLLHLGTVRGKKDATTALFKLSVFTCNSVRIVNAGAVKHLVGLVGSGGGMVDRAVAVLANLSMVGEGRATIVRDGGIPLMVEVLELGSFRGKENAASVLLQLCIPSAEHCIMVLREGVVPSLVALSQAGTPTGKEKAQQLLSHFRSQRGSIKK